MSTCRCLRPFSSRPVRSCWPSGDALGQGNRRWHGPWPPTSARRPARSSCGAMSSGRPVGVPPRDRLEPGAMLRGHRPRLRHHGRTSGADLKAGHAVVADATFLRPPTALLSSTRPVWPRFRSSGCGSTRRSTPCWPEWRACGRCVRRRRVGRPPTDARGPRARRGDEWTPRHRLLTCSRRRGGSPRGHDTREPNTNPAARTSAATRAHPATQTPTARVVCVKSSAWRTATIMAASIHTNTTTTNVTGGANGTASRTRNRPGVTLNPRVRVSSPTSERVWGSERRESEIGDNRRPRQPARQRRQSSGDHDPGARRRSGEADRCGRAESEHDRQRLWRRRRIGLDVLIGRGVQTSA